MSGPEALEDQPKRVSAVFNAIDSDVTFQSCDGMLLRIHRKNLEAHAAGFPPSEFDTNDEAVLLSENSSTLEQLFQFIYPSRHPDLERTEFVNLAPLAEAAEKYEVFSAINICKIRMRNILPRHAVEVMSYAARHGYGDIVNETAPLLITVPLEEMVKQLPLNLVVPWVCYHESWNRILSNARSKRYSIPVGMGLLQSIYSNNETFTHQIRRQCAKCECILDNIYYDIISELRDIQSLLDLNTTFAPVGLCCPHIVVEVRAWRASVEAEIRKVKPFLHYL